MPPDSADAVRTAARDVQSTRIHKSGGKNITQRPSNLGRYGLVALASRTKQSNHIAVPLLADQPPSRIILIVTQISQPIATAYAATRRSRPEKAEPRSTSRMTGFS